MAISPDNPWLPQTPRDLVEFMLSPISLPYTFGYAMSYFILKGTDEEVGPPDWRENVRNYGIWTANAGIVWAYNRYMHPGKYEFVSASKAFQLIGKVTPWTKVSRVVPGIVQVSAMVYGMDKTTDLVSYTLQNTGEGRHPLFGIVPLPILGTFM